LKLLLDERPLVIAIAGPNGAGKSTFYETQLKSFGLPFVNADNLARQLDIDAYKAAGAADTIRRELVRQRTSFVFETVFSDPVGDKVAFLQGLEEAGYRVILCFIGISGADISEQRVSMRVSKGGHDVPQQKIAERYARTLNNLKLSIENLADVRVFDNDDLEYPYRLVAHFRRGQGLDLNAPVPTWLGAILLTRLGPSQEDHAAAPELKVRVQQALSQLPLELREAVVLNGLEDMDYKEIARVLNVPESTVKSRVRRGRGELARLLKPL
jgi:RNA polymerase sigma factor (sigma-70 family)